MTPADSLPSREPSPASCAAAARHCVSARAQSFFASAASAKMRAFSASVSFPKALLEQGDAVGNRGQQIEAGVADIGGREARRLLGQEIEQRARPAAFGVDEARQRGRPDRHTPSRSSAKARCAALARLSRPTTSAGSPGSAASAARRSGPNAESAGTPASSLRTFAGSSVIRLLTISRTGPNGERAGISASSGSISSRGFLRRQRGQRLARRIGGRDPFDARRQVVFTRRERNRTGQIQRRRQVGQQASFARREGAGPDVFQSLGERLLDLTLADQAVEQEQRVPDGAVQRDRVAEHDLGLLEQPLGGERLGPAHIGRGEGVPPFRPAAPA